MPTQTKRQLADTWFAQCLARFFVDKGLAKGRFARMVGKDPRTISRWLYDGLIPPASVITLLETTAKAPGYFAKCRVEVEAAALKRLKTHPRAGRESLRGGDATVAPGDGDAEGVGEGLRGLDLNGAAQKIADAIKQDLLESEVDIGLRHNPTELERSRALVWALKDLARWLHNHGYHVQHLFKVTDEMAGDIGLPVRRKEDV